MPSKKAATKGASGALTTTTQANTKVKMAKPAPVTQKKVQDENKVKRATAAKKPAARKSKKADAIENDTEVTESKKKKSISKAKGTKTTKAPAEKSTSAAAESPAIDRAASTAKVSRKRKATDEDAPPAPAKKIKFLTKGPILTEPSKRRLNIYVFGEGTAGELGLGTAKNAVDVKRPRLNPNLSPATVGVTQIAAGGMHCIALTHDNKVLTWGVNDQGTLGRNTEWEGGLKDMDENASDNDDDDPNDNGLNPKECLPAEVDWSQTEVAEDTRFVRVAAGDSSSFVLTDDGKVYGWGTFRSNDGIFGFTPDVKVATRPLLIAGLSKIVDIKAGANHALAMDIKGAVFAWGSGQQNQLGRRVVERTKAEGLIPREFGLPKGAKKGIVSIETGNYHNFALSKTGEVYTWGLNNFGETGIMDNAGQDDAVVMNPRVVKALSGKKIISIKGGGHHSLAATEEGDCLIWGRLDGAQTGIAAEVLDKLPEDAVIKDEHGRPRILAEPQKVGAIQGAVTHVTTSSDHSIVLTKEGKAWSWGFSANYQTGLGTDDDVLVATLIDNTAVRDKQLVGATTGGQFSVLTAWADVDTKEA